MPVYRSSNTEFYRFFVALLLMAIVSFAVPAAAQDGELLKGVIQQQEFVNPGQEQFGGQAPGLTRKDIIKGKASTRDPFDSSSGESPVDVPADARTALMTPPSYGAGIPEQGLPGAAAGPAPASNFPTQEAGPLQASVSAENDPDNTPEMQIAWDQWHKRVAAVIFQRYDFFAHSAFRFSPPLMSRVSYTVTSQGHIQNLAILQRSSNPMFEVLITQCIKSLDGDQQLLPFPSGSRRSSVEKFGTFTQNYGIEGLRYTTGDKETIRK